jgi:hypothetical protein
MKSRKSSRLLDLERGLPTDKADVSALRKTKDAGKLNLEAYLAFLASLDAPSSSAAPGKKGCAGHQPFEL